MRNADRNRTIKYQSLIPIQTRHHDEYYKALDEILRYYNNAGFGIKEIHCDGEYHGMMNKVKDDLDVKMNFTNAKDHVPEAEGNNRTIKERIRATFQPLPYKAIPRIMIRYLAMNQADQMNLFPVKGGVSSYYSPRMILSQTNLDYTKDCTVPFGSELMYKLTMKPTRQTQMSQEHWTLFIYAQHRINKEDMI
jgi:hypothetical protein